jgi:hypothetical protein
MKHQESQKAKQCFSNAMLGRRDSENLIFEFDESPSNINKIKELQKELSEIKQRLSTLEPFLIVK